jgi:hypothetical protein
VNYELINQYKILKEKIMTELEIKNKKFAELGEVTYKISTASFNTNQYTLSSWKRKQTELIQLLEELEDRKNS